MFLCAWLRELESVCVPILCQLLNALCLIDVSVMQYEPSGLIWEMKPKCNWLLKLINHPLFFVPPFSSSPSLILTGCEVDIFPVWCFHPAGGSVNAEHHGRVWLACVLNCHVKVSWIPRVHQHPKNYSGQQVSSLTLYLLLHHNAKLFWNISKPFQHDQYVQHFGNSWVLGYLMS